MLSLPMEVQIAKRHSTSTVRDRPSTLLELEVNSSIQGVRTLVCMFLTPCDTYIGPLILKHIVDFVPFLLKKLFEF